MYCKFFGFRAKPFDVTSNPTYLYLTPGCKEVLATLLYGVRERRGFVIVLGEAGTGKTTVLKSFMDQLDEKMKVASIFTTDVTFEELLQMLLIALGLKRPDEDVSKVEAFGRLSRFAVHQNARGGNLVVIIDEAQNLNDRALENIRLLSNFETRKNKLIQIVLAGQPELDKKLNHPRHRQLAQRIGLQCCLNPLTEREVYAYVEHRLRRAAYSGSELFNRKAREMVWTYSEGIPRRINILCDKALLIAYACRKKKLDESIVNEAIKSLHLRPFREKAEPGPPRPDQRPKRWRAFIRGPKFSFLAGLGAATCLFFVLFSPFSAFLVRSVPEQTRFSSAIEISRQDSTEAKTEFKPVISSVVKEGGEKRTLPESLYAAEAGREYQQIVGVEADTAGQTDSHPKAKSDNSPGNVMVSPGDTGYPGIPTSPESKKESRVIMQLGSYQEKPTALRLVNNFVKEGYDAYLQKKVFKDGRIFYRVRLRCSGDINEARGIQSRLRDQGFESAFIVHDEEG